MKDDDFIEGVHFYIDESGHLWYLPKSIIYKEDTAVAVFANIVLTIMKMQLISKKRDTKKINRVILKKIEVHQDKFSSKQRNNQDLYFKQG